MLAYIAGTLLFIPTPILYASAGALFGLTAGFALASLGSVISAALVFLAGRYWSRKWVLKKIVQHKKVKAIDDAVTASGWKMVLPLRLTFVMPFFVMNYALGLSKIPFWHYILASWVGLMPGMLLYSYLGSVTGRMLLEGTSRPPTTIEWVYFGLGFVATVWVSVYAGMIVKKAIKNPPPS